MPKPLDNNWVDNNIMRLYYASSAAIDWTRYRMNKNAKWLLKKKYVRIQFFLLFISFCWTNKCTHIKRRDICDLVIRQSLSKPSSHRFSRINMHSDWITHCDLFNPFIFRTIYILLRRQRLFRYILAHCRVKDVICFYVSNVGITFTIYGNR